MKLLKKIVNMLPIKILITPRKILLICLLAAVSLCYMQLYTNYEFHLFCFPKKTYVRFEKRYSLCSYGSLKYYKFSEFRKCPKNGIITVRQGGRLGNQIWEYISVWLVAQKSGLEPYVPSCLKERLSQLFDNLTLPTFEEIRHCPLVQKFAVKYVNAKSIISNESVILPVYASEQELLAERINDITKVFTIKKELLDKSQNILLQSVEFSNFSATTFIGIHVRRTDYFAHLEKLYEIIPDFMHFFQSAITYFENKYPKSIFIIVSDDTDWCWENFGHKKNVYIPGKYNQTSPELDMAIMASCNHSIIDYGTFGQWGALFARGETVFYDLGDNYVLGKLGKLLNWHALQ